MKKAVSLLLIILIVITIIPVVSIPVAAKSSPGYGRKELSLTYGDKTVNVYYKCEKTSFITYKSTVTFEYKNYYNTTVVNSTTLTNLFFELSFEKACRRNNKINNIISKMQEIAENMCRHNIVIAMSENFNDVEIKEKMVSMWCQEIEDRCLSMVKEQTDEPIKELISINKVLGAAISAKDLADDIKKECGVAKKWWFNVIDIVYIFGNQMAIAQGTDLQSSYKSKIETGFSDLNTLIKALK